MRPSSQNGCSDGTAPPTCPPNPGPLFTDTPEPAQAGFSLPWREAAGLFFARRSHGPPSPNSSSPLPATRRDRSFIPRFHVFPNPSQNVEPRRPLVRLGYSLFSIYSIKI